MNFLRRYWTQIQVYLSNLSFNEKAVAVMAVVVLVVALIFILQFAMAPEMSPLPGISADRRPAVLKKLKERNIRVDQKGDQVLVPTDKQVDAMAVLMEADLFAPDSAAAFDDYVKSQNALASNSMNAQNFLLAKRKWVSLIVSKMAGVRTADVFIAVPENIGFGRTTVRPSASVNVVTTGDRPVKPMVRSIANFVAGTVAGMSPQDVALVVDGNPYKAGDDQDALPTDYLDMIRTIERRYLEKVDETLRYIPNRIVQVSVQVDPTKFKNIKQNVYSKAEPLISSSSKEKESNDAGGGGGAPGARSMTGADIETGGGGGRTMTERQKEERFGPKELEKLIEAVESGHTAKQVSVTVNVPRSYFVKLANHGKPDNAPEPDDAAIQQIAGPALTQIKSQVQNLINTAESQGVVETFVYADFIAMPKGTLAGGGSGSGGGGGFSLDSGWVKPAGLLALAVFSVALMLSMVRKATRQQTMPTAQELAGVPPSLPSSDDELVGEADETDQSMAGVELNEEEMRARKIAEQIADMIKANPAEAASLVKKWVKTDA